MSDPTYIGRYRLQGEVARGGMGAVYRAVAPDGQQVALKVLLAGTAASPLQRRRVATEVQALLRLRHPNVVALLDAGEQAGVPWLAMEWIHGETLEARLERDGPMRPSAALGLVAKLCDALTHCHAQGVLHRDLKPANVLLRAGDGEPLLTDFGLSKDLASESQTTLKKTLAGLWLGTPGWWPPEQAMGEVAVIGPRSDVYGLGAILYATLTGVPPQAGESLQALLEALDRPPPAPSSRRPGLPRGLDEVCLRALARAPEERPASASELADQLRELQASTTARGPRRERSYKAAAALILTTGAATAVGLASVGSSRRDSRPPPRVDEASSATEQSGPLLIPSLAPPALPADGDVALAKLDEAIARAPDDAASLAARGALLSDRGRLKEGLADLERAIQLDSCARTICNRGITLLKLGRRDEALRDFRLAAEGDPTNIKAWLWRGRLLFDGPTDDVPRQAEALRSFERVMELAPRIAFAHAARGACRSNLGRLEEALEDIDRAIAMGSDPHEESDIADFWRWRAVTNRKLSRWSEALDDLERCASLGLSALEVEWERALILSGMQQYDQAIAMFDRVIAADPRRASAWHERARARVSMGCPADEVIADCDRALELAPRALAYYWRGNARRDLGQAQAALDDFTRAIELDPMLAEAWVHRAAVYGGLGLHNEELADLDRAVAANPGLKQAFYNRGVTRAGLGMKEGAVEDYGKALEIDPDYVLALGARGKLLLEARRVKEGMSDLDRLVTLDPVLGHLTRGLERAGLGQQELAIQDYDQLLRVDPRNAKGFYNRANARRLLGRVDEALDDYGQAIAIDAQYFKAFRRRGMTLAEQGRWTEALSDIERALKLAPGERERAELERLKARALAELERPR